MVGSTSSVAARSGNDAERISRIFFSTVDQRHHAGIQHSSGMARANRRFCPRPNVRKLGVALDRRRLPRWRHTEFLVPDPTTRFADSSNSTHLVVDRPDPTGARTDCGWRSGRAHQKSRSVFERAAGDGRESAGVGSGAGDSVFAKASPEESGGSAIEGGYYVETQSHIVTLRSPPQAKAP